MLFTTPVIISQLFQMVRRGQPLPPPPLSHKWYERMTTKDGSTFREIALRDNSDRNLWIAFSVDGRELAVSDLLRFCSNRSFKVADLVNINPGLSVYNPTGIIDVSDTPEAPGFRSGQIGCNGYSPFFQQNVFQNPQFGDWPPGPQIGDQPIFRDLQQNHPGNFGRSRYQPNTAPWFPGIRSADDILKNCMSPSTTATYNEMRHRIATVVIESRTDEGWFSAKDLAEEDPSIIVSLDRGDMSNNAVLVVKRLIIRELKELGYNVEWADYSTGFTVRISIDV